MILNIGEQQAEDEFKWWHGTFGDDFYVEINRHNLEEEDHVNKVLLSFAQKYNVKVIASNNVYYLDQEDSTAHDILLCVKDGEQQSTPKGKGRGYRYGFPNDESNKKVEGIKNNYAMGFITNNERYNQVIDVWTTTNARLTGCIVSNS